MSMQKHKITTRDNRKLGDSLLNKRALSPKYENFNLRLETAFSHLWMGLVWFGFRWFRFRKILKFKGIPA